MTRSFKRGEAAVVETTEDAPVPATAAAPAPTTLTTAVQSREVVTYVAAANDDVQGDIDFSDIKLPRLNLVQRTGDLPDRFEFGAFVLNKECSLGKELRFIALNIKKQYQEKTKFGTQGRVFNTREEVKADGGVFGFRDGEFSELAHIHLLIQMPEGLEKNPDAASVIDLFIYEIDGKLWAPMVFSVGRSSYTALAKPLLTSRQFQLRDGLWRGGWELISKINKGAKGSWATPNPRFLGKLKEEDAVLTGKIRKREI
jgi:hypothetical protein